MSLRIVYDAMTVAEEEKLRSIEEELLKCLDSAGITERHYWLIRLKEGIRYIGFGRRGDELMISAKRVTEMPASELLALVKRLF